MLTAASKEARPSSSRTSLRSPPPSSNRAAWVAVCNAHREDARTPARRRERLRQIWPPPRPRPPMGPARLDLEALCHAVSDTDYIAAPAVQGDSVESNRDPDHWDLRVLVSWPLSVMAQLVALAGPESATAGWTFLVLGVAVESFPTGAASRAGRRPTPNSMSQNAAGLPGTASGCCSRLRRERRDVISAWCR